MNREAAGPSCARAASGLRAPAATARWDRERPRNPRPFARKAEGGPSGGAAPTPETTSGEDAKDDRAIVCLACDHAITHAREALSVAGSHTHTFMNPGGHVFEIACYRDAPGAVAIGRPSSEWSWFPGASWRACLCGACRGHLGWKFDAPEYSHFGLIRDRIGDHGRE